MPPTPSSHPIIGSIVCTPSKAQVGQSVRIEVRAPSGHAYGPTSGVDVSINGIPGAAQYAQWETPGTQPIIAVASSRTQPIEYAHATIEIEPAADVRFPIIRIVQRLEDPTNVEFSVAALRPQQRLAAASLGQLHRAGPRVFNTSSRVVTAPRYQWDFGDGHTDGGMRSWVSHDYRDSLDPNRIRTSFDVTLRLNVSDEHTVEARRTVSVLNLHQLAKRRGFVQLRVDQPPYGTVTGGTILGTMTLHNLEPEAVTLASRRLQPLFADPDADSFLLPREAAQIHIGPRQSTSIRVVAPRKSLGAGAVGFAVHFFGQTASGIPSRASAYVEVPSLYPRVVLHPRVVAALRAVPRTRGNAPLSIGAAELAPYLAADHAPEILRHPLVPMRAMSGERLLIKEGDECHPDDLPDPVDIPEHFVCQATPEKNMVWMPDRFMNARKGDIVLSPGGGDTDLIGQLLRHVQPPQHYAHCGMMTKNHQEITHATASSGRLQAYPVGTPADSPTNGHRPDVVKFGWPGIVTQTVDAAIHGEEFIDPEVCTADEQDNPTNHRTYSIGPFNPDESMSMGDIIPALVVKPDPAFETQDIREVLHQIAAYARQQGGRPDKPGKGHYRFFAYTDPTIGLTPEPAKPGWWAGGTYATVCSSFVWLCIRQKLQELGGKYTFELPALEPADTKSDVGGELQKGAADGLYLYRAQERLAAGEVLYALIWKRVWDQAIQKNGDLVGKFALGVTDTASDVANQMLNTFASDWSDTESKDSDAWRQTSDANAVSPDNMMMWDRPLYGYVEPLIYRTARFEEVTTFRWRKVVKIGKIQGTVEFDKQFIDGARVQLSNGDFTFSKLGGSFQFDQVPEGPYEITAQQVLKSGAFRNTLKPVPVTVSADTVTPVTVVLAPPDPIYREVRVIGTVIATDIAWGVASAAQDVGAAHDFYEVLHVSPGKTHEERGPIVSISNDAVRGDLVIAADWHPSKAVTVKLTLRLFDGPSEDDEIVCEYPVAFDVNEGGTADHAPTIHDGDRLDVYLTVKNVVDQS